MTEAIGEVLCSDLRISAFGHRCEVVAADTAATDSPARQLEV